MLSLNQAKVLIRLGREAVKSKLLEEEFEVPEEIKEEFNGKIGVFTTLYTYPEGKLRGCVGVPEPLYPLWYGVIYSSLKAAFSDTRFSPLELGKLNEVVWELSVLSEPEELDKELLPGAIRIGKDGVIVERGKLRGLLLPKVATEYGLSPETFLAFTCRKASLPDDCWKEDDTRVFRFQSKVFREKSPYCDVGAC